MGEELVRGSRLLALRMSQYLLLFGASVIVTRALGPELRAQYALALALGTTVWGVVNLSIDSAALRLLGRREASLVDVSRTMWSATLVLAVIGCAITVALGLVLRNGLLAGASVTAVVLATTIVALTLVQQTAVGLLLRLGALRAYGWISFAGGVVQVVAVAAFAVASSLDPEAALGAAVLALFVRAVALTIALARNIGLRALVPGGGALLAKKLVRAGAVLHVGTLAVRLTLRIDLFLVSALATSREVGLYSLAVALSEILFLGITAVGHAAIRVQTDAEPAEAARSTLEFVRQCWPFVLTVAVVLSLVAYPLVVVAFGSPWSASVPPLMILSYAAVAFSLEGPVRTVLGRIDRPVVIAAAALTGTAVNIALNLALIPLLGISGAALSSLLAYWLYALILLARFHRVTGLPASEAFARPRPGDLIYRSADAVMRRLPGRRDPSDAP